MQNFFNSLFNRITATPIISSVACSGKSSSRSITTSSMSGASANVSGLDAVVSDIASAHSPNVIALTTAAQFLEEKVRASKTRCRTEFSALESLQKKKFDKEFDYSVAMAATELDLNRYVDVLPYEHTRVKLIDNGTLAISSKNPSTTRLTRKSSSGNSKIQEMKNQLASYVNASTIVCSDPVVPGSNWKYIAAQGPLPTTCRTFWDMVVQEKVHSIVMLTDIIENKKIKCHEYFPLKADTVLEITPGLLRICTKSVTQLMPGLVLRKLEVINKEQGVHVVDHYHYTGWPDHGVPQSAAPLFLLSNILRNTSTENPILVHCSAGIGRSGVFCVVDTAARRLVGAASAIESSSSGGSVDGAPASSIAAVNAVNVAGIVSELRQQRAGMVQTTEQFVFCHVALLELTKAAAGQVSLKLNDAAATT